MKPRTGFYMNILGLSAFGIFFLGLGIYALSTFLGHRNSPQLLVAGAGGVYLGLLMLWKALEWARPIKASPQNLFDVCPFCGAIVEKSAILCEKCGRQLAE